MSSPDIKNVTWYKRNRKWRSELSTSVNWNPFWSMQKTWKKTRPLSRQANVNTNKGTNSLWQESSQSLLQRIYVPPPQSLRSLWKEPAKPQKHRKNFLPCPTAPKVLNSYLQKKTLTSSQSIGSRTMLSSLFWARSLSCPRSTLCLWWNKRSWTPSWRKICTPDEFDLPNFLWQLQCSSSRKRMARSSWFRTIMHSTLWQSRTSTPSHWSLNSYPNSVELDTLPSWMSIGVSTTSALSLEMSGR